MHAERVFFEAGNAGFSPMDFLLALAALLGTDPITLIVLGALSGACAHFLGKIANAPWLAMLFFPVLTAGGLIADDAAVAVGLYPGFDIGYDSAGWKANWPMISDGLPNVLMASTAGMTVTAILLLLLIKGRQSSD